MEETKTTGQAEGFDLMIYRCDHGHTEILWNSRDGITPFSISCRKCDSSMVHAFWDADVKVPDFKPPKGMRIFVDLTMEQARIDRRKYVEEWWDKDCYGAKMKDEYPTKEDAIERLARLDVDSFAPHTPSIKTVE